MKTGNILAANAKIYGDFIKVIQKNMSEELKNQ
jgi:myo-inositol-1(or 4)-monophosphatase